MLEQRTKSRGEEASEPQKMLKVKVDPEMYMKTKDQVTIFPTQKTTFLPGCTPFYTEMQVFGRNRRLFCQFLSPENRTGRFEM